MATKKNKIIKNIFKPALFLLPFFVVSYFISGILHGKKYYFSDYYWSIANIAAIMILMFSSIYSQTFQLKSKFKLVLSLYGIITVAILSFIVTITLDLILIDKISISLLSGWIISHILIFILHSLKRKGSKIS